MRYWEQQMKEKGHRFLLTSTQADEDAQFFYRKLGYTDTGSILFPGQAATELLLLKPLRNVGEENGPRQKKRSDVSADRGSRSVQDKCITDVQYKVNSQFDNLELNSLFADAWPGPHQNEDFSRVLRHSLGYVCAYKEGELVGFVNIAWDGGAHAFLLDTTVRSDCRRQGIGRQLVRHAEELTQKNGVEWLHVNFEPQYEEFYRKCGFRESRAGLINLKETERS